MFMSIVLRVLRVVRVSRGSRGSRGRVEVEEVRPEHGRSGRKEQKGKKGGREPVQSESQSRERARRAEEKRREDRRYQPNEEADARRKKQRAAHTHSHSNTHAVVRGPAARCGLRKHWKQASQPEEMRPVEGWMDGPPGCAPRLPRRDPVCAWLSVLAGRPSSLCCFCRPPWSSSLLFLLARLALAVAFQPRRPPFPQCLAASLSLCLRPAESAFPPESRGGDT